MLKNLIRITSVITAFFILALSYTAIRTLEISYPFNSSDSFLLNIQDSKLNKTELINTLDTLAKEQKISIFKPVADSNNPITGRNVFIFGEEKTGPVFWLNKNYEGHYFSARDMTTQPLNGTYYIENGSKESKRLLMDWAGQANLDLLWTKRPSVARIMLGMLSHTGSGLALLSAFMLMFSVCLTWFLASEKNRAIRLMSGQTKGQIRLQDFVLLGRLLLIPGLITLVIGLFGLCLWHQSSQILALMVPFLSLTGLFVLALVLVCLILLSYLFLPSVKSLAKREKSAKHGSLVNILLKVGAILLVVIGLPLAIYRIQSLNSSAKQLDQWANISDAYSLIFDARILSGEDRVEEQMNHFFDLLDEDQALISVSMDAFVNVPPAIRGTYDQFVITNQAFLDALNTEPLEEVVPQSIPEETLAYIKDNLRLWSKDWQSTDPKIPQFKLYQKAGAGQKGSIPVLTAGVRTGISVKLETAADLSPRRGKIEPGARSF